jgi:hypothetical protein
VQKDKVNIKGEKVKKSEDSGKSLKPSKHVTKDKNEDEISGKNDKIEDNAMQKDNVNIEDEQIKTLENGVKGFKPSTPVTKDQNENKLVGQGDDIQCDAVEKDKIIMNNEKKEDANEKENADPAVKMPQTKNFLFLTKARPSWNDEGNKNDGGVVKQILKKTLENETKTTVSNVITESGNKETPTNENGS